LDIFLKREKKNIYTKTVPQQIPVSNHILPPRHVAEQRDMEIQDRLLQE
jgi:hypothetical protein